MTISLTHDIGKISNTPEGQALERRSKFSFVVVVNETTNALSNSAVESGFIQEHSWRRRTVSKARMRPDMVVFKCISLDMM